MADNDHPSLEDFDKRLKRLKAEVTPPEPTRTGEPASGLGMAFAMAAHLVAGVGVGAGIGYVLDGWLGTAPALLILLLFLGAAGGMLNVYRTATRQGMALGYRPAGGGSAGSAAPDQPGAAEPPGGLPGEPVDRRKSASGRDDRENSESGRDDRDKIGDGG